MDRQLVGLKNIYLAVPGGWWPMRYCKGPSGDMPCLLPLSTIWRRCGSALSAAGGVGCWYPQLLSIKSCTAWRTVLMETSCSSTRTYKSSASGSKDALNTVPSFQHCGWVHGPDLQAQPWGGWQREAPQEPYAHSSSGGQLLEQEPGNRIHHLYSALTRPIYTTETSLGPSVPGTDKPLSSMESTLGWGLENLSCEVGMMVQGLLSLEKRHFQENLTADPQYPLPTRRLWKDMGVLYDVVQWQ